MTVLPKDVFPRLLKKLIEEIQPTAKNNLKAGFQKYAIYPIDKQQLLSLLPQGQQVDVELVSDTFLNHLEKRRSDSHTPQIKLRRKLDVPAGKSIAKVLLTVSKNVLHHKTRKLIISSSEAPSEDSNSSGEDVDVFSFQNEDEKGQQELKTV